MRKIFETFVKFTESRKDLETRKIDLGSRLANSLYQKQLFYRSNSKNNVAQKPTRTWKYILSANPLYILSAPVIYGMIIPLLFLDITISIYQAICFRVYGIPRVKRSCHIRIDRHRLSYLNTIEKLNCMYCGYGNGLISYSREIMARTEQYWCPIKHARRVKGEHQRTRNFVPYNDAESYKDSLGRIRQTLKNESDEDHPG